MTTPKRTCSVDDCDDAASGNTGWCDLHKPRRVRSVGKIEPGSICSIGGCEGPLEKRGWCGPHYQRWRVTGAPVTPDQPCAVCGVLMDMSTSRNDKKYCSRDCSHSVEDKEHNKARAKAKNAANPEPNRARARAWYKANPERVKARIPKTLTPEQKARNAVNLRRWRKENPGKRNAQTARRRAKRRGWMLISEPASVGYLHQRDNGRCGLCGGKVSLKRRWPDRLSPSVDHIIPLSRGGDDTRANKQLAHLGCNNSKRDRAVGEQLRLLG
jgi:5-methylcytosine-specific restriction endonuclease McrA